MPNFDYFDPSWVTKIRCDKTIQLQVKRGRQTIPLNDTYLDSRSQIIALRSVEPNDVLPHSSMIDMIPFDNFDTPYSPADEC